VSRVGCANATQPASKAGLDRWVGRAHYPILGACVKRSALRDDVLGM
jgi:hypothetical protein